MSSTATSNLVCIIPLNDEYEVLRTIILELTGLPFSIKDFNDFIITLLGGLIPPYKWDVSATVLFLQMYFSNPVHYLNKYTRLISGFLNHMSMPIMPAAGFKHRYFLRADLTLYIYYEKIKVVDQIDFILDDHATINTLDTKESILLAIENGDYIDELTRYKFGIT